MNCRAMKDVAIANWQAKSGTHREQTDESEEKVLRDPKFAEIEVFVGESAGGEG